MSKLVDFKTALIKSLNRMNGETVAVTAVKLKNKVVGNPSKLDIVAIDPLLEQVTVTYNQLDVASLFSSTTLRIPNASGFNGVLDKLKYYLGFELDPNDFVTQPVQWSNNQATLLLKAADSSYYFKGEVTLTLTQYSMDLSVYLPVNQQATPKPAETIENFKAASQANNGIALDFSVITVGGPVLTAANGLPTAKNSAISYTALAGSQYSGKAWMYFDRKNVADYGTITIALPDDWTGDGQALLAKEVAGIGSLIPYSDFDNFSVDLSKGRDYTFTVKGDSVHGYGQLKVTAKYYSEVATVANLVYSADDTTMTRTKFHTAIKNAVGGSQVAVVNVTVNANVNLVAASTTDYALDMTLPDGMAYIRYNLVNKGIISGRGGRGGEGHPFSAGGIGKAGDGGNAILVPSALSSAVKVSIDNSGAIYGGGGGGSGSYASNGGSQWGGGGGGGAPLGQGGSQGGQTATLTTQGIGGNGSGGSPNVGGAGGARGGAGNWSGYGTTVGSIGQPGKAIVGLISGITWVNVNRIRPTVDGGVQKLSITLDGNADGSVTNTTSQLANKLAALPYGFTKLDIDVLVPSNVFIVPATLSASVGAVNFVVGEATSVHYTLKNYGKLWGRGGDGGSYYGGQNNNGGPALTAAAGVTVDVYDYSAGIFGGGGGSALIDLGGNYLGGGGGRPLGNPGRGYQYGSSAEYTPWRGSPGTLDAPGSAAQNANIKGGDLGKAGSGSGSRSGGNPGLRFSPAASFTDHETKTNLSTTNGDLNGF